MSTIPNPLSAVTPLVWFITGTSQGFGNRLVRAGHNASAGETRSYAVENDGGQSGDPALAADAIIKAVTAENLPLHLLLGKLAYERANAKLDALKQEFAAWREVTLATDFQS